MGPDSCDSAPVLWSARDRGAPAAATTTRIRMTSTSASTQGAPPPGPGDEAPSLRAFIARNKRLSISAITVVVALLAAVVILGVAGSGAWHVRDSTSCSGWSSANQSQQTAYARLYVNEHGALPSGASDLASVKATIDNGCLSAFGYDEADTVNVVQAIKGQY